MWLKPAVSGRLNLGDFGYVFTKSYGVVPSGSESPELGPVSWAAQKVRRNRATRSLGVSAELKRQPSEVHDRGSENNQDWKPGQMSEEEHSTMMSWMKRRIEKSRARCEHAEVDSVKTARRREVQEQRRNDSNGSVHREAGADKNR